MSHDTKLLFWVYDVKHEKCSQKIKGNIFLIFDMTSISENIAYKGLISK